MNHGQANNVKKLVAPVNKVLERLEWECPVCGGTGLRRWICDTPRDITNAVKNLPVCPFCDRGKVNYSHIPQVGKWYLLEGKVFLVKKKPYVYGKSFYKFHEDVIPILHWEEIKRILGKAGYQTKIKDTHSVNRYFCGIFKGTRRDYIAYAQEKSCQEAVMLAVIELGKEIKE